jgi:5-methylcytosine-specific restriction protein B
LGTAAWSKPDPSALSSEVPKSTQDRFPGFEHVFRRYGKEMYCNALLPTDKQRAYEVIQAFFDLYAFERGWKILKGSEDEYTEFHAKLRNDLFPTVSPDSVYDLLKKRRFIVLQGPPGTGKTRLAEEIQRRFFTNRGMTIQFHPAVTYEDFVVGLSPDPKGSSLRFDVRPGWLLQAAKASPEAPYLLTIDEINRADLGKVLGEAVYLFEPDEIGSDRQRQIRLPHSVESSPVFCYPENLYILATMNTADRSIAGIDLAIRRRFAFVTMLPERDVVAKQNLQLATETFDQIANVFVEHVSEDGFDLLPGQAYFLAKSEADLKRRFRYELLPLLDEYLRQGLLGAASGELFAVRDSIADQLSSSGEA